MIKRFMTDWWGAVGALLMVGVAVILGATGVVK